MKLTPCEPALALFVAQQPHRLSVMYRTLAHYIRREGVVSHERLQQLIRHFGLTAAEMRAYVAQLAGAGFVEQQFPGYKRRSLHYRWLHNDSLDAPPTKLAP